MKITTLVANARTFVTTSRPYSSSLIYSLIPHFEPGMYERCGHFLCTTRKLVVIMDPDFILKHPEFSQPEMLATGLYHEGLHHLQDQDLIDRLMRVDRDRANIAADLVVNYWLQLDGMPMPSSACLPAKYGLPDNRTIQWYFDALANKPKEKNKEYMNGLGGSLGGGDPTNAELKKTEEEANTRAVGREEAEVEELKETSAVQLISGFRKRMTAQGAMPGWLSEAIPKEKAPRKVPWHVVLRHRLVTSFQEASRGRTAYSYSKPSSTMMSLGQYHPGLYSRSCEVAFVRDTSASMDLKLLGQTNALILQCVRATGQSSVWSCDVDAKLQRPLVKVPISQLAKLPALGGGGTSFVPFFKYLEKMPKRKRPKIVVYMTDGYGTFPKTPPAGVHTVWCILGSQVVPPWGTTVYVSV